MLSFPYRLTTNRETYRVTRDSINAEHSEQSLPETTERNEPLNHPLPTQYNNITVDDPQKIQRMQQFHRQLTALQNTQCSICLEKFPSITTNEAGVCNRCQADNEVPRLYSAANNMNPGPVPPELCVSSMPSKFNAEIINLMISTQYVFFQLTH